MNTCVCCATLIAGASAAFAAGPAWQGLNVKVEELPAGTRVNGVLIAATRFSGPDVATLTARLERQWTIEPGSTVTRWSVAGPWRVLSRTKGSLSQVLQIPDQFGAQSALLSQLDLRERPVPPPSPSIRLPQTCTVTSTVHSGSKAEEALQLVAFCRAPSATVGAQLRQSARAAGLTETGPKSGSLVLLNGPDFDLSAVVTQDGSLPGAAMSVLVLQQQRVR